MMRLSLLSLCSVLFLAWPLQAKPEREEAEALLRGGNYDEACPRLEALLVQEPTSDAIKMGLVQCLLLRSQSSSYPTDLRRALGLLQESIRLHEGIPGMEGPLARRHFYAGMALWYLNRSEQALSAFDRARRLDPSLHQALYNTITILEQLGRHEEARLRRQLYIRIHARNPF